MDCGFCYRIASWAALFVALTAQAQTGPTITTSSLPGGEVGAAYASTLAATGGQTPYSWAVSSGSLPPGLSLSRSGAIDGTPTAARTSNFTLRVTDAAAARATKALSIAVAAAVSITTRSLPAGTAGVPYSQNLVATGGLPPYKFTVIGTLPAGLSLSGATISGTPSVAGTSSFTVQVTDLANQTAIQQLSIPINPAALQITTASLPAGTVGVAYSQSLAATGGTPPYTWTVTGSLPAGLTLSGATISGTPSAAGAATFTAQVSAGKSTANQQLSITINPAVLAITTTTLPQAVVGSPYSQTLSATGGVPPYTWALAGDLSTGLALSGSTISGIPSVPGTFSFSAQVNDAAKNPAVAQLTLLVRPAALQITTPALPGATVGMPYTQTLTATGGAPPYTWSASGNLPTGLALSGASLSGNPSAAGSFSFGIQVSDNSSQNASHAFTVTVNAALTIVTASLADAFLGSAYSQTLSATGGTPPYTWSVASGALPDGLSLNATAGLLSGTPRSAGSSTFVVQLKDGAGVQVNRSYTMTTSAGLTITTAPVFPAGTAGTAYDQALTAAGGAPPYTWSITAGSLPAGVSLSSTTGHVSGTPSAAGQFQFTVQVSDNTGAGPTKAVTLTIAGALVISTAPSLPDGNPGAAYAQPLSAAGGTPPYTWSITSGPLPQGLQLDPATGMISGNPAATGTFSFTAQVADTLSIHASKQFSVRILSGLVITSTTLPNGMLGNAYSQALAASGGVPPYSWLVSAASLPPGLNLDPASGVLAGTPSANGTFNFTAQVADAGGLTSTRDVVLVIGLPSLPSVSINGGGDVVAPLQQPAVNVALGAPYASQITGRLNLSFTPDAVVPGDDAAIQFASGGRTAAFTIPANSTTANFSVPSMAVQTGSVAGAITLTLTLESGGADLTPPGGGSRTMRINRSEPIIRAASVAKSSSGFQLLITGLSTGREVTSVLVRLTPAAGSTLQTTDFAVPLADLASKWYQDPASAPFGSQFTLTVPFTLQGDPGVIDSATVTLSNQTGTSQPASIKF